MRTRTLLLVSIALALTSVLALVATSPAATTALVARLTGSEEVPDPGDPDGTGRALIRINDETNRVCFNLVWRDIGAPTMAHIHEAPDGEAGPVVVTLFTSDAPLPDTIKGVRGCADEVDPALAQDIASNPRDYYVNIHNPEFPAGAIRGQLRRPRR